MQSDSKIIPCDCDSRIHAFAGNPLSVRNPQTSFAELRELLQKSPQQLQRHQSIKIVPFFHSKPLVSSPSVASLDEIPSWHLAWQSLCKCRQILNTIDVDDLEGNLVYVGHTQGEEETLTMHWALNLNDFDEKAVQFVSVSEGTAFVDVRTLMIGTFIANQVGMAELSIAGQVTAMLKWQKQAQFCSKCGTKTVTKDGGRRRECENDTCKRIFYPRLDPVVIMLVIDKANNRAVLARQSQFFPHMWSCLAGFIETGESIEEAVRRETWEEIGIEVDEVVYHSSQPWPVGPASMPCQLIMGFLAFAKSFDIHVDKNELEDAQWYRREEVKKILDSKQYMKDQKTYAFRINQLCAGSEKVKGSLPDVKRKSEGPIGIASMFFPGPYAIAHHLISSWVNCSHDSLLSRL